MTLTGSLKMASWIGLAFGLTACGGGGGGVASIPTPAVTPTPSPVPTPTPTPTPTAMVVVSAPEHGSTGPALTPLVASAGGANFTTGPAPGQVFPLLQTTMVLDRTSVEADSAANAIGGTATVIFGDVSLTIAGFDGMDTSSGYANLDWTRVGYWSTGGVWDYWEGGTARHRGVFVTGYETPATAIPTTGSASYTGQASGSVFFPITGSSGITPCECAEVPISGVASFTANFGARSLSGSMTGMTAPHPWDDTLPNVLWNDVAFSATIIGGRFSGDAAVSNSPSGYASLGPNAVGSVDGKFFGPTAEEAGAVWTLFDGTRSAIGTLTGKRP